MGYNASKEEYFCGLKIHLIISASGQPKEFMITPASEHDLNAFKKFSLHTLARKSRISGDKAYNDYAYEYRFKTQDLHLCSERKYNAKRPICFSLCIVRKLESILKQLLASSNS